MTPTDRKEYKFFRDVEETILGVVEFGRRLLSTSWHLVVSPRDVITRGIDKSEGTPYSRPLSYFVAAILLFSGLQLPAVLPSQSNEYVEPTGVLNQDLFQSLTDLSWAVIFRWTLPALLVSYLLLRFLGRVFLDEDKLRDQFTIVCYYLMGVLLFGAASYSMLYLLWTKVIIVRNLAAFGVLTTGLGSMISAVGLFAAGRIVWTWLSLRAAATRDRLNKLRAFLVSIILPILLPMLTLLGHKVVYGLVEQLKWGGRIEFESMKWKFSPDDHLEVLVRVTYFGGSYCVPRDEMKCTLEQLVWDPDPTGSHKGRTIFRSMAEISDWSTPDSLMLIMEDSRPQWMLFRVPIGRELTERLIRDGERLYTLTLEIPQYGQQRPIRYQLKHLLLRNELLAAWYPGCLYLGETENSLLYLSSMEADWNTALAFSRAGLGYLVTVDSPQLNALLLDQLIKYGVQECWIGLSDDQAEGEWKWCTGRDSRFSNWAPNEPNNAQGGEGEDAALIVRDWNGKWNDGISTLMRRFIIQLPLDSLPAWALARFGDRP